MQEYVLALIEDGYLPTEDPQKTDPTLSMEVEQVSVSLNIQ